MQIQTILDFIYRFRRTTCAAAGAFATLAMAPFNFFPALLVISLVVLIVARETRKRAAVMDLFLFGMGYFIVGLYWVQNAVVISIGDFWWVKLPVLIGLPLLLVPGWMLAGWLCVRFTAANTAARGLLIVTLLSLAEFGRSWIMTGFPWNNFAYTWIAVPPLAQMSAIGGIYWLNTLTILWMATPALLWLGWKDKTFRLGLAGFVLGSIALGLLYGALRLHNNPTILRDDVAAVVVQPNIAQIEKWDSTKIFGHFEKHIALSQAGLKEAAATLPDTVKSIAVVWPETSLDESMFARDERVPADITALMQGYAFKPYLVSGLWRQEQGDTPDDPKYFNSVTILALDNGQLAMRGLYDKYRLVPFGEYVPLVERFGLKPVTGFSGFKEGAGPTVLHTEGLPPVAPAICFEVIFPWSLQARDADWIVNVSNDGWYGDTTGPYQHLVMTQFRAIEQGRPIMRSTTTGISAAIDSYGRVLNSIGYEKDGYIVSRMPQKASGAVLYSIIRQTALLLLLGLGFCLTFATNLRSAKLKSP